MRRMVPDTQAALRGIMNSKPSQDTRVTYSEVGDAMLVRVEAWRSRSRRSSTGWGTWRLGGPCARIVIDKARLKINWMDGMVWDAPGRVPLG